MITVGPLCVAGDRGQVPRAPQGDLPYLLVQPGLPQSFAQRAEGPSWLCTSLLREGSQLTERPYKVIKNHIHSWNVRVPPTHTSTVPANETRVPAADERHRYLRVKRRVVMGER